MTRNAVSLTHAAIGTGERCCVSGPTWLTALTARGPCAVRMSASVRGPTWLTALTARGPCAVRMPASVRGPTWLTALTARGPCAVRMPASVRGPTWLTALTARGPCVTVQSQTHHCRWGPWSMRDDACHCERASLPAAASVRGPVSLPAAASARALCRPTGEGYPLMVRRGHGRPRGPVQVTARGAWYSRQYMEAGKVGIAGYTVDTFFKIKKNTRVCVRTCVCV